MKISVTIPAYKAAFLKEAIESVAAQTYPDWELIIVDDCSPEDLKSIAEPFLNDARIRYFRNEKNCGALNVVDNWNICLKHCSGDYVLCMGDDDRLLPYCLEEYLRVMEKYPHLNVYHAQTQIIDERGKIIGLQEGRPEYETCKDMLLRQWKHAGKQFLGDFLFSRRWLEDHGGYVKFPLGLTSDRATANLAAKDNGIANTQSVLFEYRDTPLTISRSQNLRIAIHACNDAYKWYSLHFAGMLPQEYHGYYVSRMTDMIYLDVQSQRLSEAFYWLKVKSSLILTYPQIINACIRGLVSSLRR